MMKKILIACGGSGGHILPALRLSQELCSESEDLDIVLVTGTKNIERAIIPPSYKLITLDVSSIKLNKIRDFLISIFKLFKSALKSLIILIKFRPRVVVGFGGYASFFVVFFARCLRKKTVIHEENVLMGRANRLLGVFVDRISLGFSQTKEFFPLYKNKMIVTGNPIRKDFKRIDKNEALEYFGFRSDYFTILVMGGSQGAHRINMEFLKSIPLLKGRLNFQVIHLAGENDYDFLKKEYNNINLKVALFRFLESMSYAFSSADLVISRAGAMTISELIFFKLPAIVVPYPYAYGHQIHNARILSKQGCAILIEDKNLNAQRLADYISDLFKNPEKLKTMHNNYNRLKDLKSMDLWQVVLSLN